MVAATALSFATQLRLFVTVKKRLVVSISARNEKVFVLETIAPDAVFRHSYFQSGFEMVVLVMFELIHTKVSSPAEAFGNGIIFHRKEVSLAGQAICPVEVSFSVTSPFVLSCLEGM